MRQHAIAEEVQNSVHGCDYSGVDGFEYFVDSGPVITQDGQTYFDLDLGQAGTYRIVVQQIA